MANVDISGSLFASHVGQSAKWRWIALPLSGIIIVMLACAFAEGGKQTNSEPPINDKAPAPSRELKYLIFWSDPEKAGELAERIGVKGDGKTRLLGFGVPNA